MLVDLTEGEAPSDQGDLPEPRGGGSSSARPPQPSDGGPERLNSSKGKRKRPEPLNSEESSESDTEGAHQDLIHARRVECQTWRALTGVLWLHFQEGRDEAAEAVEEAKEIVQDTQVFQFYIGVCKSPAQRFYEKPMPEWVHHMERFHAMYVLCFGRNMGEFEKKLLSECRSVAAEKCVNKSGGGEGIHCRSLRCCYVAVRYRDTVVLG